MANRLVDAPDRRIVLIVEDDDVLRMVLRIEFEKNGFNVREAEHGQAALASIAEIVPDIIITDLMMPVMDGLSFIAAVRKTNATVPIIAVSAAGGGVGGKAVALGANRFCIKPLSPEILLAAVKSHLFAASS